MAGSDAANSCNQPMGHLAPGHFSFTPDELNGREVVATIRTSSDGEELVAEFKATVIMEISAFEKAVEKQFKKAYWLSEEPLS